MGTTKEFLAGRQKMIRELIRDGIRPLRANEALIIRFVIASVEEAEAADQQRALEEIVAAETSRAQASGFELTEEERSAFRERLDPRENPTFGPNALSQVLMEGLRCMVREEIDAWRSQQGTG